MPFTPLQVLKWGACILALRNVIFEPSALALVCTGDRSPPHWEKKEDKVDFFDLKAILENLFATLKISSYRFQKSHYTNFHPGRQAEIQISNVMIGIMGEVHPLTLKEAGLEVPVYFAELNLEDLLSLLPPTKKMEPLPLFLHRRVTGLSPYRTV